MTIGVFDRDRHDITSCRVDSEARKNLPEAPSGLLRV